MLRIQKLTDVQWEGLAEADEENPGGFLSAHPNCAAAEITDANQPIADRPPCVTRCGRWPIAPATRRVTCATTGSAAAAPACAIALKLCHVVWRILTDRRDYLPQHPNAKP